MVGSGIEETLMKWDTRVSYGAMVIAGLALGCGSNGDGARTDQDSTTAGQAGSSDAPSSSVGGKTAASAAGGQTTRSSSTPGGGGAQGGNSQTTGGATTAPSSTSSLGGALGQGGTSASATTTASGGGGTTGGTKATGGTSAAGGSSSTGGTKATGGSSATGGTKATGGSSATGGTSTTGGTLTTDGCPVAAAAPTPGTVVDIGTGTSVLLDAFPAGDEVLAVFKDKVERFSKTGQSLGGVSWPREITATAFDGTVLAIADKARLTKLDVGLTSGGYVDLIEPCQSAVLLSNGRFICGPANDWDRLFYSFDMATVQPLQTSAAYTYNGIPMRRVSGRNDFVTVTTDSSPSDFHLYTLNSSDKVTYINESPYHGDFRVTNVYAFYPSPATHLVTDTGILLHIYGTNCALGSASANDCLVKDGNLGTLSGSQLFAAMTNDESGNVYGLVIPQSTYGNVSCSTGCTVQKINVGCRVIESQRTQTFASVAFSVFRYDPAAKAILAGWSTSASSSSSTVTGYRLAYLSYQ